MKKTIISFLLIITITTPVFASDAFNYYYRFGDRIYEFMGDTIPGAAVAVVDMQNGFAFSKGYGYGDAEKTISVTDKTLFQTSGVSASFVALMAVRMAQEGKIDLDAKVSKYVSVQIPASPVTGGNLEMVTVRMLMEHISGLPDYYLPDFYSFDKMDNTPFNNLHARLSDTNMSFKPYENVSDSQVAVTLLGYLLAKTAYPELSPSDGFVKLADELLSRLDMTGSSFGIHTGMEPMLSYSFDEAGQPTDRHLVAAGLMPASSLWSSASEMKNYLYFLLDKGWYKGNQIVNVNSFTALFEPDEDAIYYDENNYYGLTWLVCDTPWGTMYKIGGGGAYPSALIVHPEQRIGIFVTCNGAAGKDVMNLANELITEMLSGEPDYEAWQDRAHIKAIDKVWDQLTDYTGYYYGNSWEPLRVTAESGVLHIIHPETGLAILPEEDGRYIIDSSGNWLSFKKHEDTGRVYIMQNGYPIARRMTELVPSAHAGNFYGVWTAKGENARYSGLDTLTIERDEKGLARMNGVLLQFLGKDNAYTYGFGQWFGLLLYRGVDEAGTEYIRYAGERYYKQYS